MCFQSLYSSGPRASKFLEGMTDRSWPASSLFGIWMVGNDNPRFETESPAQACRAFMSFKSNDVDFVHAVRCFDGICELSQRRRFTPRRSLP